MARAQGSQVELAYVEEVTPGTTPGSPSWLKIRKNSGGPTGEQGAIESGEIRSDRENASDIAGNNNVSGSINTELSDASHDDFIRSAMYNDWTDTDTGLTTLDTVASGNTVDRASGSFITDGFVVGQWVQLSGFTSNNGWAKITSVSALSITLAGITLTDETGGGDERVHASYMKGGTTLVTHSIVKRFTDINQEIIFTGCLVDSWQLTIAPEAVVEEVFTINGRGEGDPTAVGSAASDVSTADPMASFSGVVLIDDTINSNVTNFGFTLANNNTDGFVVGSRDKIDQFAGRRSITGNVSFYFENLTEYTDSKNHTQKDFALSLVEGSAYYGLTFPRAYWSLPTPDGDEGPLLLEGDFRARYDSVTSSSIIVSRSLA